MFLLSRIEIKLFDPKSNTLIRFRRSLSSGTIHEGESKDIGFTGIIFMI